MYYIMIIINHKAIRFGQTKHLPKATNKVIELKKQGIRAYYIKKEGK